MADPHRDQQHLQFSLGQLLWFTTAVAVLCASLACATQGWGNDGDMWLSVLTFLFWPSFAAVIAWTCPEISNAGRNRIFAVIGIGVVLLCWGYAFWLCGFPIANLGEFVFSVFVGTFMTMLVVWLPQMPVAFAVAAIACEWRRKRECAKRPRNRKRRTGRRPMYPTPAGW